MARLEADLTCFNCGASFGPDAISPKRRFAECEYCGTLHAAATFDPRAEAEPLCLRRLPDRIRFGDSRVGSTIEVAEQSESATSALAWITALSFVLGLPVVLNLIFEGSSPALLVVAACMFVMIGLSVLLALLKLFNKLVLTIDRRAILVTSRPWLRPVRRFPMAGIRGVIAVFTPPQPGGGARYQLVLVLTQGTAHCLLPVPLERDEARAMVELVNTTLARFKATDRSSDYEDGVPTRASARQIRRSHKEHTARLTVFHQRRISSPVVEAQELSCVSCGSPLPLESIDRNELAATCTYCGVVTDMRSWLKVAQDTPVRQLKHLPDGISLKRNNAGVTLEISASGWLRRIPSVFWLLFCLAGFDLVTIMPFVVAHFTEIEVVESIVACGVATAFLMGLGGLLLRFLDRHSYVGCTLGHHSFSRHTHPRRDSSDFMLAASDIRSFYVQEHENLEGKQSGFVVFADAEDGSRHLLLGELTSASFAIIIANVFNDFHSAN